MKYFYLNKAFKRKIEIIKNQNLFGTIKFNFWDSEVSMILGNQKYLFKRKSVWSLDYILYNIDNEAIAEILFPFWKAKTIINTKQYGDFIFYPTDFWRVHWQLKNENTERLSIVKTKRFWNQEGEIISEINNESTADFLVGIAIFVLFVKIRRASKDGAY